MNKRNISYKSLISRLFALKLLFVSVLLLPFTVFALNVEIEAFGYNTIAGNPTFIKSSQTLANQDINFVIEKPDGLSITIPAKTGDDGFAQVEFYDYHTKKAGEYKTYAYFSRNNDFSAKSFHTFTVYPAEVSAVDSEVETNKSMVKANGEEMANVSINLKDKLGNAVSGHAIKVISSRVQDQISFTTNLSDQNGHGEFQVKSTEKGISSFIIIDSTADVILEKRVQLVFTDGDSNFVADSGGDLTSFIPVALAADAGPLDHFEITDLPASIAPNENVSFKVKAQDKDNQVVQNYTGTIHFSAEGQNSSAVSLPQDYTFKAEDLGMHQFSLGLSFAKTGSYNVIVNDLADKFKKGEKSVVIVVNGNTSNSSSNDANKPAISSPIPGTYSQNTQTITGSAKAGSSVKIFDNSVEIGSILVNAQGKFSFQTSPLTDGIHKFYVVTLDNITKAVVATSDTVEIIVDTTPPKIDQLVLDPSTGITAGSVINVKIYSESKLSQAAVVFNSDIVELTASLDTEGLYTGSIQAPKDPGVYILDFVLVDELQNEVSIKNGGKVTVDSKGGKAEVNTAPVVNDNSNQQPSNDNNTPAAGGSNSNLPANNSPSQVSGLIAYGSDKRVTLVWEAATDDKQVKNYRVYYGVDLKNLDKKVDTKDASTTWYIPVLENGKEYFFAVTALDGEGNESMNKSEIVSGIPFMLEVKTGINQKERPTQALDSSLHSAAYGGPLPTSTPSNGPEVFILIGASAVLGKLFNKSRKVKK